MSLVFVYLLSSWKQFRGDIVVVVSLSHIRAFSTPHPKRKEDDLKLPVVFSLVFFVCLK